MWDLDTIIRQNNQIAVDGMMQGWMLEEAQAPMPEVWPLTLLADKLKAGPPHLAELCNSFISLDTGQAFLELIREFLPEHEEEIMLEPRNRRVYRFGYIFGEKYYPLPLNTQCGIDALLTGLPVELMGMSYSAYHELDMRKGYLLLLSLVIYPYEGDWRDEEDDLVPFDPAINLKAGKYKPSARDINWVKDLVANLSVGGVWVAPMGFTVVKTAENRIELKEAEDTPEVKEVVRRTLLVAEKAGIEAEFSRTGRTSQEKISGARVPLLDMVKNMAGREIANLIPAAGWHREELHRITDDTPYNGIGDFADWVCSETGCTMLDSSFDNVAFMEGMSEPIFRWTRYNVMTLLEQWPKVQQVRRNIDKLVAWLEADLINNFRELLDFILKGNPKNTEETGGCSYDPSEHLCELDMQIEEEDDEDGIDGPKCPTFSWAVPKELGIPPDPLRLRLDFHHQSTVMTYFNGDTAVTIQVDAMDVAHALASDLSFNTGLLPQGTLWWANTREGPLFALYAEPKIRKLALQRRADETPARFEMPLPGFIFLCTQGRPPWVYAVTKKPTKETDKVYAAPLFNIFQNGRSCQGSHKYPARVIDIVESFFISFFSPTGDMSNRSKAFPSNMEGLWRSLHKKKKFPIGDLIQLGTIKDLMTMELR